MSNVDVTYEPWAMCVCGHYHYTHQHYRRGTDCALCRCRKFRHYRPNPMKGVLWALFLGALLWSAIMFVVWLISKVI